MQSDSFIVIQGFMCNELGLKGNDLLVYALIHGFSQDGKSKFFGGRQYIADTFNISLPTVDKALQNLIDRDLIIKERCADQSKTDSYYINISSKETLSLVVKKLNISSKETLPNNIDITKDKEDNNFTNVKLGQAPAKHRHLIPDMPKTTPVKKKSRYEQCVDVIDEKIDVRHIELKEVLTDYLKMRLAIKDKPMYVSGWRALIKKLQELSDKPAEQCLIVRQSLENSWATFYPLKNNYKRGVQDTSVFSEFGKVKSDVRKDEVIVNVQY